ncbi:MAG: thioredoxin family protein, partial [Planctomycetota bacterium]
FLIATATPTTHGQGSFDGLFDIAPGGAPGIDENPVNAVPAPAATGDENPVTFTLGYQLATEGTTGRLTVRARIQPGWHVYSTTLQPSDAVTGKPMSFEIDGDAATFSGPPTPSRSPKNLPVEDAPGAVVEEFTGGIEWTIPLKVASRHEQPLSIVLDGLACRDGPNGQCMPFNETMPAVFVGTDASLVAAADDAAMQDAAPGRPVTPAELQLKDSPVLWQVDASPRQVAPGGTVTLKFTATPELGYHLYPSSETMQSFHTVFTMTGRGGFTASSVLANQEPITAAEHSGGLGGVNKFGIGGRFGAPAIGPEMDVTNPGGSDEEDKRYHYDPVTWTIQLSVPEDAPAGSRDIAGRVIFFACTDNGCLPPQSIAYTTKIDVADETSEGSAAVLLASAAFSESSKIASDTLWVGADDSWQPNPIDEEIGNSDAEMIAAGPMSDTDVAIANQVVSDTDGADNYSWYMILGLGFLSGLLLNVMPCVLPVLGLKVMSVLDNVGASKAKLILSNLAYTLGILVVFWGIGVAIIVFGAGFGQHFTNTGVQYGFALAMFAIALSCFGIWEIPLPGFTTGQKAQDLQKGNDATGSFFKGVFTTVLATPCGAPLMGTTFIAMATQPAWVGFATMTAMGLGFALPYLLLVIFPGLARLLPKPGAWMETFKQLLGFGMLMTTAVFMFPMKEQFLFPTFVSLIGVWFACWLIGKYPAWKPIKQQLFGWTVGLAGGVLVCWGGFWVEENLGNEASATLADIDRAREEGTGGEEVQWVAYSDATLEKLRAEGRPVLVDFTADWCQTCKFNYIWALNTKPTAQRLNDSNAVALEAVWDRGNPNYDEVNAKMGEFGLKVIPVLAFYPGDPEQDPIIVSGPVSQGEVLKAIDQITQLTKMAKNKTAGPAAASLAARE